MPINYTLSNADDAVLKGLQGAYGLMSGPTRTSAYPSFVSSQTKGPSQASYIGYTANTPMAQQTLGNYQLNNPTPTWQSGSFTNNWERPTYQPSNNNTGNYYTGQDRFTSSQVLADFMNKNPDVGSPNTPGMAQDKMGVGSNNTVYAGQIGTNSIPQSQGGYGTVNTAVNATPWSYKTTGTNATTAGYNWGDTTLAGSNVSATDATAGSYGWNNANLGMREVSSPFSAYGGDANIQAAQINQGYNKLGSTPQYEGLMGGDYEKLQQALQAPGEIAAKRAYAEGQNKLASTMGDRGLYGSSIMANNARTALDTPYMETLASNASNAAVQRYGQQATDLQNKNAFGLNVYGQQMGENQSANQMALEIAKANQGDVQARNNLAMQAWQQRMAENQAGNETALQASLANQSTNANLQGLLGQQNIAQNSNALDYAKLQTGVSQQNAANQLAASQSNQANNMQLQGLLSQQGLAKNANALDYAKLETGVNQQNIANALAQSQQSNQLGFNNAQLQTQTAVGNADRAMQQQQALNALRSGDIQAYNQIMSSQNLAQNAFNQNTYNQQMSQNKDMNDYNLAKANFGLNQNRQIYDTLAQENAGKQAYDLANLNYKNQGNEATRQWENQQKLEQFQYDLAKGNYTDQQRTQMINEYLALAGRGQVTSGQNQAAAAANNQIDAQNNAGLGTFLGGLLGNIKYNNGNWSWG